MTVDSENVYTVGFSGAAESQEQALELARSHAVHRFVEQMVVSMRGTPIAEFVISKAGDKVGASGDESVPVATRYLKQLGLEGTPERVDVALNRKPGGFEAYARY